MRAVFKLLGIEPEAPRVRDPQSVERIAAALSELAEPEARFVASYAYVLARVAHADWEISAEELRVMEQHLGERAGLPAEHVRLVVEIAASQALALGANENYVVTRLFRELSTREQRLALLECLFAVAAADEDISTAENHEIAIVAGELGLRRDELARVRARYREHLSVLKDLPGSSAKSS